MLSLSLKENNLEKAGLFLQLKIGEIEVVRSMLTSPISQVLVDPEDQLTFL